MDTPDRDRTNWRASTDAPTDSRINGERERLARRLELYGVPETRAMVVDSDWAHLAGLLEVRVQDRR